MEKIHSNDVTNATVTRGASHYENVNLTGFYTAKCYDKNGNLKWEDTFSNLVTTQGKNNLLDKYLAGSAYTAVWSMGLIDNDTYSAVAVGDTAAVHAGWVEANVYNEGTRGTPSFAAASSGSKSTSADVSFSINSSVTVKGAFLCSNNTKTRTTNSGANDILYSAGLFSGGDKVLGGGDTLNVSYTASA
jgi:hypothetical protein